MSLNKLKKKHVRIITIQTIIVVYQIIALIASIMSWKERKDSIWEIPAIRERNISILVSLSLLFCLIALSIMLELRLKYRNKEEDAIFNLLNSRFTYRKRISLIIFTVGFLILIGISAYALYIMFHFVWIMSWKL